MKTAHVVNFSDYQCPHGHNPCPVLDSQSQLLEGSPIATFVLDDKGIVRFWNKACEYVTGLPTKEVINTKNQWKGFYPTPRAVLADLVLTGNLDEALRTYKTNAIRKSTIVLGAYEAEGFFPHMGTAGKWLYFTAAPLLDSDGKIVGAIETLQDITAQKLAEKALAAERQNLEAEVQQRTAELTERNHELLELAEERSRLEANISFASTTAMTAMTSMGEMGQVLRTVQSMYGCREAIEICDVVTQGLREYGLEGCIQIRMPKGCVELATDGAPTEHDIAALNRLVTMGRIVQFHNRMAVNYEYVSVLIRNIPIDDADKTGRIRDNIAILVEAANVRANALIAVEESDTHKATIITASSQIRELVNVAATKQGSALEESTAALNAMMGKLERRYLSLGLSNSQEEELTELIKASIEEILSIQSTQYEVLESLQSVGSALSSQ